MKQMFSRVRARTLFALLGTSALVTPRIRARTCDVSFLTRMPAGIPGDMNRVAAGATVTPEVLNATNYPDAYGRAVVIDASTGKVRLPTGTDVAASIAGFLVRAFPTQSGTDPLGTSTPPTSGPVSVMRRGFMTVALGAAAAAVKGGTVYIRIAGANAGANKYIGGVEAAADSTNTVALSSNCYFNGPADSAGNVEIAFNL